MPSFFDKKEEVISLELTQYGKYLLSIGKLDPIYYAFYDEDIVYDTKYAGYEESQNNAEKRILENTPTMKSQYVFSGIETYISENIQNIRDNKLASEYIQQTAEKVYSTSMPMGTSQFSSEFSPAWSVRTLEGKIELVTSYFTGSHANIKVPQIHVKKPEYVTKITQGSFEQDEQCEILGPDGVSIPDGPNMNVINDVNIQSKKYKDGTYMEIQQDNIVLQIDEINSLFENDNFDLEVYMIENDNDDLGGNTSGKERLIPLYFIEKQDNIINDILVDLPEEEEQEITKENVEYYLQILVDKELPDQFLLDAGATERSGEVFYNEEQLNEDKNKKVNVSNQRLYTSEYDGPVGDEC